MIYLAKVLTTILDVFVWIIVIQVAMSWLIVFGVVNTNHPQARNLINLMERITGPVYLPLRKFIPSIGGIDLTPLIIIIAVSILKDLIYRFLVF